MSFLFGIEKVTSYSEAKRDHLSLHSLLSPFVRAFFSGLRDGIRFIDLYKLRCKILDLNHTYPCAICGLCLLRNFCFAINWDKVPAPTSQLGSSIAPLAVFLCLIVAVGISSKFGGLEC